MAGKPLIAWSIRHALEAQRVQRVIVSTDSEEYATIARQWGAEVPFLRPAHISEDFSTDLEVFSHLLSWAHEHGQGTPDILVHLRPTCPVRRPGLIDEMVHILEGDPSLDSVRTVASVSHPPYKMWQRGNDGRLMPLLDCPGIAEPWNAPRQALPPTFIQTANVDVLRARLIGQATMSGRSIFGVVEEEFNDIDSESEMRAVSVRLAAGAATPGNDHGVATAQRTICFDIDGVIAELVPDGNYAGAHPRLPMIEQVNRLFAHGHRIVLHTARGSATGLDWEPETRKQLERWGLRYHSLHFGKPAADIYIDDRMIPLDEVPRLVETLCKGAPV